MEIKTCRRCHRLFNWITGPRVCPSCASEMDKKFLDVKEFIRDNPHAGILEVSEEMEVSVPQLQEWVREERLEFSKDSDFVLSCEHCGAPIFTGRFCADCKKKLIGGLASGGEDKSEKPKSDCVAGMRFLRK